ncbi:hypothetical protein CHARACLAT_020199 [Characodon lateralis]|uniref:Uncharacterized protein n=1 Tax=Characodon lateralis TaxID=208331 RepID=A0ABU7EVU3_9TELE|nr:hypothetical protein [Characodon lateralis]
MHILTEKIHTSFIPAYPCRVEGGLLSSSSSQLARGGGQPGQVASPSQGNIETQRTNYHALTHSYPRFDLTVMFLDCGVPIREPTPAWERTCKLLAERPHARI